MTSDADPVWDPADPAGTGARPSDDDRPEDDCGPRIGDDDPGILERLREDKEHLTEVLARTQAEFANYRKRVGRDHGQLQDRAKATVLEAFLPVLDAMDAAAGHDQRLIAPLRNVMWDAAERLGLERLEPATGIDFDPAVHHAVDGSAADQAPPVVGSVVRPGYRVGEQLLRAAEVVVTADAGRSDDGPGDGAHDGPANDPALEPDPDSGG